MKFLLLVLLVLAGCSSTADLRKVQPPQIVTKIVEVQVNLPTWATEQIVKPMPASGLVGDLRDSNTARGAMLDYVNCRSKLIVKVQAGEKINIKDCGQ